MDFTPTEAAAELGALAGEIAAAISTPERVAELESAAAPIDARLWQELGGAGLLGDVSFGPQETTAVATALGRRLARVPFGPHAVAALPLVRAYGSSSLADELVAPAYTGSTVLSAAVEEDLARPAPEPRTRLTDGRLTGAKVNVPYAGAADALLVSATGDDGPVVAVVRTGAPGVTVTAASATGLVPVYTVEFDGVVVSGAEVLTGGAATVTRLSDLLRLAVCAEQAGVLAAALDATAAYAREREQFGRPIGSFQAVAQRLADAYIDVQGLSLTTAQAAWLLSPEADAGAGEITAATLTAKFWADDAGHRVAHTAVHVHGGVGLDTSYPAHRYFLRAKQNEFTLGTAPAVLDELGGLIGTGALE